MPDELLSSWLTRIAAKYGQSPNGFFQAATTSGSVNFKQIDFLISEDQVRLLSTGIGIPAFELFKYTLVADEGHITKFRMGG